MQIEPLADHPELLPTLAAWHHAEWAYLRPGDTLEARIGRMQAICADSDQQIFIALIDGQLVGSAMLLSEDMDTRPDLSPWLGGVYTAEAFRSRGVGSALVRHVVQYAAARGIRRLYLFTPSAEPLYSRLGWFVLDRTRYRDTDVTVMYHDPAA